MNKNFLLISYDFPPLNSGGSYRPARFAANLKKEYGLNPIVITVDHQLYSDTGIDNSLNETLPNDLIILRTGINHKNRISNLIDTGYFFITDSVLFRWRKYLKKGITTAINQYKPGFILLSVPPFSLLNFVRKIAKKHNIPVVYDFRDPLSFWNSGPFASKAHYLYFKRIEKKCISESYKTLVVSPEMKNIYSKIYPKLKNKFQVVFNSFDKYFVTQTPYKKSNDKFIICYIGSFYYDIDSERLMNSPRWKKKPYQYFQYAPFRQDWKYRSPYYFFKSLSTFLKKHPEYREKILVIFAGKKPAWFDRMVEEFELDEAVVHKGFLSKNGIHALHEKCDAFLVTSAKFINGKDYCIAGKTYEYLSFQKPIIAFVPEGDQKWIIENSGLGVVCNPDDVADSVKKLEDFFNNKKASKPDFDFIDKFSTKNQIAKLYEILNPLLDKQKY